MRTALRALSSRILHDIRPLQQVRGYYFCDRFEGDIEKFFFSDRYVEIVYGSIGALIFSMYIVFDTQLMLGGKRENVLCLTREHP